MSPNEIIVEYTATKKNLLKVVGMVLSVLTLTLGFHAFYEFFFEPENRATRKNLLRYLQENHIKPEKLFYDVTLKYALSNNMLVYRFSEKRIALFKNDECILSSFAGDMFARRTRNKILKILHTM